MSVFKFIGGYIVGGIVVGGVLHAATASVADAKGRKEARAEEAKK